MLQTSLKYLLYKTTARHKRGHGIHSPFVYSFIRKVLLGEGEGPEMRLREVVAWSHEIRKKRIPVAKAGKGAGSRSGSGLFGKKAGTIGVNRKFGKMLYRLARFIKPVQIIELGTGAGISAGFLASAVPETSVYSVEGDALRVNFARNALDQLKLTNIHVIHEDFDVFLSGERNISPPFLVYMDGNHRYEPTLKYFDFFAGRADGQSVIVLDDIRWSKEMEKAWKDIKKDSRLVLTVDLFFMGIVFFRKGMTRQDFIINF